MSDTSIGHGCDHSAMSIPGLLIASFGGPESPEEVLPFLQRVTAGRDVPPERLAIVEQQYAAVGGFSPINRLTRLLAEEVKAELERRELSPVITVGFRNCDPSFAQALTRMKARGVGEVLAVVTSAYSSYSGCGQYREELEAAAEEVGEISVTKAPPYFDAPGFLAPLTESSKRARKELGEQTVLVCTAHSLPVSQADSVAYVAQLKQSAQAIAEWGGFVDWRLAFQSRSGSPETPWLEPDVTDVLRELAAGGTPGVVIAPLGFVHDHMEVIYDLDQVAVPLAKELGMRVQRVRTPGTSPRFVELVADIYVAQLDGLVEDRRICGPDCCASRR